MPTDDTPFAQLVLAVAAKWTGDDMEVPVFGDEMLTVAKVGSEKNTKQGSANFRKCSFMFCPPDFLDLVPTDESERSRTTKRKFGSTYVQCTERIVSTYERCRLAQCACNVNAAETFGTVQSKSKSRAFRNVRGRVGQP